jgi:hypothetical protein
MRNARFFAVLFAAAVLAVAVPPYLKAHADTDAYNNTVVANAAPVKLAGGTLSNQANATIDLATADLSKCRRVAVRLFNTLDAGTAKPALVDAAPGQALGAGQSWAGFAQGTGGATYLTVGELVAGTSESTADVFFQGRFVGNAKAQVVVAGGVTHVNTIQWDLWCFP